MFCPVCKTEYRPGFTKCADCGVDLVSRLPEDAPAADTDVPTNSEGLELLWTGVGQAVSDQIDNALDAAHISHKITDEGVGPLPNYVQGVHFVWIDPRDRVAARSVMKTVFVDPGITDQDDEAVAASASRPDSRFLGRSVLKPVSEAGTPDPSDELLPSDDSDEPVPDDTADDPDPDDATSEAWTGEDKEMAQYVADSIRGVGIGCVVSYDGGKARVLVLPVAEKRAREIVREIVEGTPPR